MPISREYIIKRLVQQLIVIFGVIIITFVITRIIPARPEFLWAGPHPTPEELENARKELHLNESIFVQLYYYLSDLFQGNWGISWRTRSPILSDILQSLTATLELVIFAFFIAIIIGVLLGISAAIKRGIVDNVIRFITILGASLPVFWLALLLQLILGIWLRILPVAGRIDATLLFQYNFHPITGFYLIDSIIQGNFMIFLNVMTHLILPGFILSIYPMSLTARMTRAIMTEVLNEQYIKTALVWGIPKRLIIYKYALKNSITPVIASLGLSFGYTIVGAFIVELIFVWPGMGYYFSMSLLSFDYPAIIGGVVIVAIFYTTINTVVDIIHSILDPRVKL